MDCCPIYFSGQGCYLVLFDVHYGIFTWSEIDGSVVTPINLAMLNTAVQSTHSSIVIEESSNIRRPLAFVNLEGLAHRYPGKMMLLQPI